MSSGDESETSWPSSDTRLSRPLTQQGIIGRSSEIHLRSAMSSLAAFVGNTDADMQTALANLAWIDRTRIKLLLFRIEEAQDCNRLGYVMNPGPVPTIRGAASSEGA